MKFTKGMTPWNKGLSIYLGGKRFEKGQIPWNKGEWITKNCEICSKEFKTWPKRASIARFCSHPCYGAWRKTIKLSEEHKEKIALASLGKHRQSPTLETRKKMSISAKKVSAKRWEGHIAKPRKPKLGLWTRTFDPVLQREKRNFRNKRYEIRKQGAEGTHTLEEWQLLKEFYQNMCLCCKRQEPEIKLTQDHVIPLTKGGSDSITNIQPLCASCNTRKYVKSIDYRATLARKEGENRIFLN